MLNLPLPVRVYLCLQPTDMRRSFDGLCRMVRRISSAPIRCRATCSCFARNAAIASNCCTGSATAWPSGIGGWKKERSCFPPPTARACRGRVRSAKRGWKSAPLIWRCCWTASISPASSGGSAISAPRRQRLPQCAIRSDIGPSLHIRFSFFAGATLRGGGVSSSVSTDATTPRSSSAAAAQPATVRSVIDPAKLPDDTVVLKQMIVELLTARQRDRRDLAALQQRLDALLQRGRRMDVVDPNQPLLFPELAEPEPAAAPPPDTEPAPRRRRSKPHGRRRPSPSLRREARRYELTLLERLCPECGVERQEIGVEATDQLDYKPAEVFVVEHQRVKYACKCCAGHVTLAPKPPQPLDKRVAGAGTAGADRGR